MAAPAVAVGVALVAAAVVVALDEDDDGDVGGLDVDVAVVEDPVEVVAAVPSPAVVQAAQNSVPSPPASSIRRSTIGAFGVTPPTLRGGDGSGDPVSGVFGDDRQGGGSRLGTRRLGQLRSPTGREQQ